ncbi:hypothetical protein KA093_01505 [Candidatus Saccharibacteria bacterium]|nr:hypothetical protein [Candidatus Saccharibacteria bacterium]
MVRRSLGVLDQQVGVPHAPLPTFPDAEVVAWLIQHGKIPADMAFRARWLPDDVRYDAVDQDVLAALGIGPPSQWAPQYLAPDAPNPGVVYVGEHRLTQIMQSVTGDWHQINAFRQAVVGHEKLQLYYTERDNQSRRRAYRYWGRLAMALSPDLTARLLVPIFHPPDYQRINARATHEDFIRKVTRLVIDDATLLRLYDEQADLESGDPRKLPDVGPECLRALRIVLFDNHPDRDDFKKEWEKWVEQNARVYAEEPEALAITNSRL